MKFKEWRFYVFFIIMGVLGVYFTNSCTKEEANFAEVVTDTVRTIAPTWAEVTFSIVSLGDLPLQEKGVCWSLQELPAKEDSLASYMDDSKTYLITGLTPETTYYVRAYVINNAGISYSNQVSFMTKKTDYGTLSDIDGNVYNTIVIGSQVWVKENLKVSRYRNGDSIPRAIGIDEWKSLESDAYCAYLNQEIYAAEFGYLYTWYVTVNNRNIAPEGWHVPTSAEWSLLIDYLGGIRQAGKLLKDTTYWETPASSATNESGFSAKLGGWRSTDGHFGLIDRLCSYWIPEELNNTSAYYVLLHVDTPDAVIIHSNKNYGYFIRCIKDE